MSTEKQPPALPSVEKTESENTCKIRANIAGFYADTVSVSAQEDNLIIEMVSRYQAGQSYYLGEPDPVCYQRVIPLGFAVEPKSLMTHYNNGKLDILVHKATEFGQRSEAQAA